jgi:two-component system, NtrC family, nitrogen regulation response regulator GlnG
MTPETSEISATTRRISSAPRVLVVDDEPLIRWALSDRLASAGCLVCEAGDGCSALDYFREGASRIDLVVLDVNLPDANGLDLLKQIRHLCPACPVVLMTASATADTLQEARDNGAYDLLPKPFDLDDMLQTVRRAVDGAGLG